MNGGGADMPDTPTERLAIAGQIYPIAEAPLTPGERFGDVLLSPGTFCEWIIGYWDPGSKRWFQLDGTQLNPTRWSPLPGGSRIERLE